MCDPWLHTALKDINSDWSENGILAPSPRIEAVGGPVVVAGAGQEGVVAGLNVHHVALVGSQDLDNSAADVLRGIDELCHGKSFPSRTRVVDVQDQNVAVSFLSHSADVVAAVNGQVCRSIDDG